MLTWFGAYIHLFSARRGFYWASGRIEGSSVYQSPRSIQQMVHGSEYDYDSDSDLDDEEQDNMDRLSEDSGPSEHSFDLSAVGTDDSEAGNASAVPKSLRAKRASLIRALALTLPQNKHAQIVRGATIFGIEILQGSYLRCVVLDSA